MAQQHMLDVFRHQRLFQQRICRKINLSGREIVGCAPVSMHFLEQVKGESISCHGFLGNINLSGPARSRPKPTERVSKSSAREIAVARSFNARTAEGLFGLHLDKIIPYCTLQPRFQAQPDVTSPWVVTDDSGRSSGAHPGRRHLDTGLSPHPAIGTSIATPMSHRCPKHRGLQERPGRRTFDHLTRPPRRHRRVYQPQPPVNTVLYRPHNATTDTSRPLPETKLGHEGNCWRRGLLRNRQPSFR